MNQTATILCVDDDPAGLRIRTLVLESAGYVVYPAISGDHAIRLFREQQPDLVISDQLLKGTVGTKIAAKMKQLDSSVPILILSGLVDTPDGMEFADAFLSKVEPPPVLLETIAKLLSRVAA